MKKVVFCSLIIMLSLSFVSSAIYIDNDFDSEYNYNDLIKFSFTLKEDSSEGYVITYLDCKSEKMVDKRYVEVEESKEIEIEAPAELKGDCEFRVEFGSSETTSDSFEISDELEIEFTLNSQSFLPGETILINGTAEKFNGQNYEGALSLEIEDLASRTFEVEDGEFSLDYLIPLTAPPTDYEVKIFAQDSEQETHSVDSGEVSKTINVESKPSSISITSQDSIQPDSNLTFKITLLDQVGNKISEEDLLFKIYDSTSKLISQGTITSDSSKKLSLDSTFSKGNAKIKATFGELSKIKEVDVQGYKKIETRISDGEIIFTNIGNVEYIGNEKISIINGSQEVPLYVNLSIGLGEEYSYKLSGFTGSYNISTSDNIFTNIPLTGYAIFDAGTLKNPYLISTIILIILLVIGLIFRKKIFSLFKKKQKAYVEPKPTLKPLTKKENSSEKTPEQKTPAPPEVPDTSGKKHFFVLCMKVPTNFSEYESIAKKYNFKVRDMGPGLKYVITAEKNPQSHVNFFAAAREIYLKSKEKSEDTSISIDYSLNEMDIPTVKNFVLTQKKLLETYPQRLVIGEELFSRLNLPKKFNRRETKIDDKNLGVYVFK